MKDRAGMSDTWTSLLPAVRRMALRAGEEILAVYATDFEVERKQDDSPVTRADVAAEAIILEALADLTPNIPVIAEEQMAAGTSPVEIGTRFWLVDPLDGTREFLNRNGDFTVNIALVDDRRPVLGVVHIPVEDRTYAGVTDFGADCATGAEPPQPIAVREPPPEGLTVVGSRRHGSSEDIDRLLSGRRVARRLARGSSLKFCLVACGEGDIYPRFGPTMEWDTAAGHAVLDAAGGCVTTVDGGPFDYAKDGFRNPEFIAWGGVQPWSS